MGFKHKLHLGFLAPPMNKSSPSKHGVVMLDAIAPKKSLAKYDPISGKYTGFTDFVLSVFCGVYFVG